MNEPENSQKESQRIESTTPTDTRSALTYEEKEAIRGYMVKLVTLPGISGVLVAFVLGFLIRDVAVKRAEYDAFDRVSETVIQLAVDAEKSRRELEEITTTASNFEAEQKRRQEQVSEAVGQLETESQAMDSKMDELEQTVQSAKALLDDLTQDRKVLAALEELKRYSEEVDVAARQAELATEIARARTESTDAATTAASIRADLVAFDVFRQIEVLGSKMGSLEKRNRADDESDSRIAEALDERLAATEVLVARLNGKEEIRIEAGQRLRSRTFKYNGGAMEKEVLFDRPFKEPPHVVVMNAGFTGFDKGVPSMSLGATEVTARGFKLFLSSGAYNSEEEAKGGPSMTFSWVAFGK